MFDVLRDKLARWRRPPREESVIFEVTTRCNLRCHYCYNVWKCSSPYAAQERDTAFTKRLVSRIISETRCSVLTMTGGEPFLRKDLPELILHARQAGVMVNLITNGTLLDDAMIKDSIQAGVTLFELQLPATDRALVEELMGVPVYDRIVESLASIKKHDGRVVLVFVATRRNLHELRSVMEVGCALGVDGFMFNRFNPGGEGRHHVEELSIPPAELRRALADLDSWSQELYLPTSCSIAMPPCFFDHGAYPNLSFGFCSAGGKDAYYTVDPAGNLRMCNHSPTILGNLLDTSFARLTRREKIRFFTDAIPDLCRPCAIATTCQGGCKAAAESCVGSLTEPDPYVALFQDEMVIPTERPPYMDDE